MKKRNTKRENEFRNQKALGVLWILLFFVLLVLLIFLGYYIYLNFPGSPEELNVNVENGNGNEISGSVSEVGQFYPNMKFNHNQLSYNFDSACSAEKVNRVSTAFSEISSQVGLISFYSSSENPDIEIWCTEINRPSLDNKDYFVAGEGGAKEIIQSGNYNIITNGVIFLYGDKNTMECNEPNVELHEIMHVFGFNHSVSRNSLMYPTLESCSQKIDYSIINELKRLYSIENLPDLLIENLTAIKRGIYLDFNLTVKNFGLADASNVDYSVYDNSELIETRKIGEVKYGAGIFIQIENFRLNNRDSKEIKFVVDADNKISELDKKNNVAIVRMSG